MTSLSDDALFAETVTAIRRAATGESQGGHDQSYDYAMELMQESRRRLAEAGHDKSCGSGIYPRAYARVVADHQFRVAEPQGCTCGAGR